MIPETELSKKIKQKVFLDWAEAFESCAGIVGGKGWNLGRLARYGFKVPTGGVLSVEAYKDFIMENNFQGIIEDVAQKITLNNIGERGTEEKLDLLREKIKSGRVPSDIQEEIRSELTKLELLEKPLAVRSSASAEDSYKTSFAGIHESFLNVLGFDNIIEAVKGCYASLWTKQAVAYRRKMEIPDNEVLMAVVFMEMAQAQAAGVSFSCDPRTGREDVLTIGANFGLGESVVRGLVESDEYILGSSLSPEIRHKKIGSKELMSVACKEGGTKTVNAELYKSQVLSDEQIEKLGVLIMRVFEAMGEGESHQDIEWVFDGKDIILVQSRPVTALPKVAFAELKDQPEIWSNANIKDAVPMVLPVLSRSAIKNNINEILGSPFKIIGYQMPEGLQQVKIHKGRAYLNLSAIQWYNFDALGIYPKETNKNFGGHQPEIEIREKKPYGGIKGSKRLWRMVKFFRAVARYKKKADSYFAGSTDFAAAFLKKDMQSLADKELVGLSESIFKAAREFAPVFMMMTGAGASLSMLVKVMDNYFPGKGDSLVNALMAGSGNITSAQHGYRLVELAEIVRNDPNAQEFFSSEAYNPLLWEKELSDNSPFKSEFRKFLDEFGHRGVYEMDISNPRWNEDPSYLLNSIRSMIDTADIRKIRLQQKEKAVSAWKVVNTELPLHRRVFIGYLSKQSSKGMELREMAKSVYTRLLEPLRVMALEIGRRFEGKGILLKQNDVFHCAWIEIFSILNKDWDGRGLSALVEERKSRFEKMTALSPPDIIIDNTPQHSVRNLQPHGKFIQGMGVAAGKASGTARLIRHPDEGIRLNSGDVLVAPSTDPGWTPLFLRASAIIMETGGYFSHGSIVAREYGIPAVINIPGVMNFLKDGRHVVVDGDEGKVYFVNY